MGRVADGAKAALWRRRWERYRRSGQTVAEFCVREGVSVASFYYWRQRLADAAAREALQEATPEPEDRAAPAFQAVRLTAGPAPLSIHLADGVRIELPGENLAAIRLVVRELVRHGGPPAREGR
jgi:hypothetical protein